MSDEEEPQTIIIDDYLQSSKKNIAVPTIRNKTNDKNELFNNLWDTVNKAISENKMSNEMYDRILISFVELIGILERENTLNKKMLDELYQYRITMEYNYKDYKDFGNAVFKNLAINYKIEDANSKKLSEISNATVKMEDQISKLLAKNLQSEIPDQGNNSPILETNIKPKIKVGKSLYTFLTLCGIGSLTLAITTPVPINIILSIITGAPIILAIISKLKS